MGIQPNELSGAHELLVTLVRMLIPIAEEPKDQKGIASFSQRVYIPPAPNDKETRFPYPVRLLTTLHQAQKQMNRWIEQLADEGVSRNEEEIPEKALPVRKENPALQKREDQETPQVLVKKEAAAPIPRKEAAIKQTDAAEPKKEDSAPPVFTKRDPSPVFPKETSPAQVFPKREPSPVSPKGGSSTPAAPKESSSTPVSQKREPSSAFPKQEKAEPPTPVQGRARELIFEVRQAIQTLSSFANLEDPKRETFRDAMKRLKPLIDDLIDAVGRGDMHSADDGAPPHRNAVPIPARQQHLMNSKQIPLPFREKPSASGRNEATTWTRAPVKKEQPAPKPSERGGGSPIERGGERPSPSKEMHPAPAVSRDRGSSRPPPADWLTTPALERKETPKREEKPSHAKEAAAPVPAPAKTAPAQTPPIFSGLPQFQAGPKPKAAEEKERVSPPHFERTSLPVGPFSPQTPANLSAKPKKKKKHFWQRGDDEDDDGKQHR